MKKLTAQTIEVEVAYCNICGDLMGDGSTYNRERIAVVYGLFKTKDFDAHEKCINRVIREAFAPYAEERGVAHKRTRVKNKKKP